MVPDLTLSEISKSFHKNEVFTNFNYTFKFGNIYKISGQNGSGKTTLFKLIKGIYLPDSGTIKSIIKLKASVSYIDNNPRSFFHRLSVMNNLEYFLSLNNQEYQISVVEELLDFFEMLHLKRILFSDLSQGQMQLVSIIRGIANKSRIIIFDESFSFLDMDIKSKLRSFLLDQHIKEKNLLLFSSHEDIFTESNFIELKL